MNVVSVCMLALTAAVLALTLRTKSGEIALLLTVACAVLLMFSVLGSAGDIIAAVRGIVSSSGISAGYLAILLKVIGICLMTEFTANTCRDAGSSALASNVTLAGKLLATAAALPLYADILSVVSGLVGTG